MEEEDLDVLYKDINAVDVMFDEKYTPEEFKERYTTSPEYREELGEWLNEYGITIKKKGESESSGEVAVTESVSSAESTPTSSASTEEVVEDDGVIEGEATTTEVTQDQIPTDFQWSTGDQEEVTEMASGDFITSPHQGVALDQEVTDVEIESPEEDVEQPPTPEFSFEDDSTWGSYQELLQEEVQQPSEMVDQLAGIQEQAEEQAYYAQPEIQKAIKEGKEKYDKEIERRKKLTAELQEKEKTSASQKIKKKEYQKEQDKALHSDIDALTVKDMQKDEEVLVKELNEKFGDKGIVFQETSAGDALLVVTADGKNETTIDLQTITDQGEIFGLNELQSFIRAHAISNPEEYERPVTKAEQEAIDFYNERNLNYRTIAKAQNDLNETRAKIALVERLMEGESRIDTYSAKDIKRFPELFLDAPADGEGPRWMDGLAGVPRSDLDTIYKQLIEEEEALDDLVGLNLINDDILVAKEDFDVYAANRRKELQTAMAEKNKIAGQVITNVNEESVNYFGKPMLEITREDIKTEADYIKLKELDAKYEEARVTQGEAAKLWLQEKTFLSMQQNKQIEGEYLENWEGVGHELAKGWNQGQACQEILAIGMGINLRDPESLKKSAEDIVHAMKEQGEYGTSRVMHRFQQAHTASDIGMILAKDPFEFMASLAGNSLSSMMPYGLYIVGGSTAAGAAGGFGIGATGFLAGPTGIATTGAGTLVGATEGFRVGMAATMFAMEYTNSILDVMREKGCDLMNPESVAEFLARDDVWSEGGERGIKRGIPIAVVDYLSAGLAGKLFRGTTSASASSGRRVASQVTEQLIFGPGSEMLGETAALMVAGQNLDVKEILAEGIGGLGNNSANLAVNVWHRTNQNAKIEYAEELTNIDNVLNDTANEEQLSNWAVKMRDTGQIDAKTEQQIQENIGIKRDVDNMLELSIVDKALGKVDTRRNEGKMKRRLAQLKKAQKQYESSKDEFGSQIAAIKKEMNEIVSTGKLSENPVALPRQDIQYSLDGKKVSKKRMVAFLDNATPEQLKTTKIGMLNAPEYMYEKVDSLTKTLKKDAVQKSSTEGVDVRQQTKDGEGVGVGDTQGTATTTEGQETQEQSPTAKAEAGVSSKVGHKLQYGVEDGKYFKVVDGVREEITPRTYKLETKRMQEMGADMTVDENGLTPEVQTLEGTGGQRTKLGTPEATTEVETTTGTLNEKQKEAYLKLSAEDKKIVDEIILDEEYESSIGAVEEKTKEPELEDLLNKSSLSFNEVLNKALGLETPTQKADGEVFVFGEQKYDVDAAVNLANKEDVNTKEISVENLPKLRYSFVQKTQKGIENADISKPVIVATTKDGLLLIDGHHRLEKAIQENKPIKAIILSESQTEAVSDVVAEETETTSPMKEKLEMQELNNIKASLRKKKGFGKDSFAYQVIDELSKSMKDENYEVSLDNQELIETVEFLAEEGVTLQNIRNIIAEEGVEGLETNQEIENYFINIGKAQKLTQGVLPRLAGIKPKAETKTEEKLPPNIVVAPYFNTTINTLEDAKKLRENEDYKAYKETLVELGKDMGIEVQVEESIGGYENDAGEKIVEISNKVVLKDATLDQAEEYAALMGALAPEVQEATIAAQYTEAGTDAHNANEITFAIEDKQAAIDALKEAGINDYTLNETTNEVTLLDFSVDVKNSELSDKIGIFEAKLEEYGQEIKQPTYRPIESRYIDQGKRKEVLRKTSRSRPESRQTGKNLRAKVQKAVERDAEFEGITAEEYATVANPKKPTKEDVKSFRDDGSVAESVLSYIADKQINKKPLTKFEKEVIAAEAKAVEDIVSLKIQLKEEAEVEAEAADLQADLGVDDNVNLRTKKKKPMSVATKLAVMLGMNKPNVNQQGLDGKALSDANKLAAWLGKTFPSVKVNISADTFNTIVEHPDVRTKTKDGEIIYGISKDGDIYINPEVHNSTSELSNTLIHEYGHIMLDVLATTEEGRKKLKAGLKLAEQNEKVYKAQLKRFKGDKTKAANETLAIMIGDKGQNIVDASLKEKFQNWLNEMWNTIKDAYKSLKDMSVEEVENLTLDEFVGAATRDILEGKDMKLSEEQTQQLKNPEVAFRAGMTVDEIIALGRTEEYSNDSIRLILKKQFPEMSMEEIDNALLVGVDFMNMDSLPPSFGNVPGGMHMGLQMFNRIKEGLKNYAAQEQRTPVQMRKKALDLLKADEVYKSIESNTSLKNLLQVELDAGLNITQEGRTISKRIQNLKSQLRQRKIGKGELKKAQNKLKKIIKDALPETEYSTRDIQKATKLVMQATPDTIQAITEDVNKFVIEKQEQMKAKEIKGWTKLADTLGKKVTDAASKVKSNMRVDAKGQEFFKTAAMVLKAATIINPEKRQQALDKIGKKLFKTEEIKTRDVNGNVVKETIVYTGQLNGELENIIDKYNNGEILTTRESTLFNLLANYDSLSDIMNKDLSEVRDILSNLEDEKKAGASRLAANRLARAERNREIQERATKSVENSFGSLIFSVDPRTGKPVYEFTSLTKAEKAKWEADVIEKAVNDNTEIVEHDGKVFEVITTPPTINPKTNKPYPNSVTKYKVKVSKRKLAGENERRERFPEYEGLRKATKIGKWAKGAFIRFKENPTSFFNAMNIAQNLKTMMRLMDEKGTFFENEVNRKVDKMTNDALGGLYGQRDLMDNLARKHVKGNKKGMRQLQNSNKVTSEYDITLDYEGDINRKFTGSQLMRLYALSKNEAQRNKLMKHNRLKFTEKSFEQIEEALGPELTGLVDEIVEYLSDSYFESVNDVYKNVNDVSMNYVENYFPTRTDTGVTPDSDLIEQGDFQAVFSAQYATALKERTNTTGEVKTDYGFFSELDSHFEQMENFKAMAEGVKDLNALFSAEGVKSAMQELGSEQYVRQLLNMTINPNSYIPTLNNSFWEKAFSRFTQYVLGFKLWQAVKQSTSFIEAFEDYKFSHREEKGIRNNVAVDLLGFTLDAYYNFFNPYMLYKNYQKAKEMSPTFRDRMENFDLYALESGRGVKNRSMSWWRKASAFPTVLGDAIGVMGYMINYNRDIANGMSEEAAMEKFNRYNETQQTRRTQDLTPAQASKNILVRGALTFGSTAILQMQKVMVGLRNVTIKAIKEKRAPSDKDIRAIVINLGLANTLFVFASNFARWGYGNPEDQDDIKDELAKATFGIKMMASSIPLLGAGIEGIYDVIVETKNPYDKSPVNPLQEMYKKIQYGWKDEGFYEVGESKIEKKYVETAKNIAGLLTGLNADPLIGAYDLVKDFGGKDALGSEHDVSDLARTLGITKSYLPSMLTLTDFVKFQNENGFASSETIQNLEEGLAEVIEEDAAEALEGERVAKEKTIKALEESAQAYQDLYSWRERAKWKRGKDPLKAKKRRWWGRRLFDMFDDD